jgi:hypothetical protein
MKENVTQTFLSIAGSVEYVIMAFSKPWHSMDCKFRTAEFEFVMI